MYCLPFGIVDNFTFIYYNTHFDRSYNMETGVKAGQIE